MEHGATESGAMEDSHVQAVLHNPKFQMLVHKKRILSWSLSALMLFIYIGFILLVAYAPDFLHSSFSGVITWGIPLGIGVIVAAFVLSAVYAVVANGEYERLTQEVVDEIKRNSATADSSSNQQQGAR